MTFSPSSRCTTLIAEDEPLAAQGLADWVAQQANLQLVGICGDGNSALKAVREHQPSLLLMDIQMPGISGLDVLRALLADPPARLPQVIFTTAYDAHALTAFELHAVDYLLKPFTQERFNEAVEHALSLMQALPPYSSVQQSQGHALNTLAEQALPALQAATQTATQAATQASEEPLQRLLVRDMGRIVPIAVESIEHLRSDTKYTAIASKGRQYLVRLPITEFERRLDPQRFLKVSRSCIVNLDFVEAMTPDESSQFVIQLRDGTRVTASREVSKQLRTTLL